MTKAVPQPVNCVIPMRSSAKKYFFKSVNAFAAKNPLGGLQSAAGKTFAAAGGVAQCDSVGRRIEADFMRARMLAGAVGAHIDAAGIATLLHSLYQMQEACRRVRLFWRRDGFPKPRHRSPF